MIRKLKRICSELTKTRQNFGWIAAAAMVIDRLGGKLLSLNVVQVVWLDVSQLGELDDSDDRFKFCFLNADQVRRFSEDSSLDLNEELADRIEADRDFCFAALEGDRLAAYGWYASECIEPKHNFNVAMSYAKDTAYMYKGFTHPDYRGLRLHGRTMGLALQGLGDRGITFLVSTVAWTNWASLRSCDRLGYERLGYIIAVGSCSRNILHTPQKAKRKGVQFGQQATQREADTRNRMPHVI